MIITSDLHLTDRPTDAYRWGIFECLKRVAEEHGESEFAILGDLTDAKDNHSAALVNRVVNELMALGEMGQVYILRGNHDYVDAVTPFFRFLRYMTNMVYINTPRLVHTQDLGPVLFVPHDANVHPYDVFSTEVWKTIDEDDDLDVVLMHQTVNGAELENGTKYQSDDSDGNRLYNGSAVRYKKIEVISGDIHVPQTMRNLTYVGAPYAVHFGDNFKPRVIAAHWTRKGLSMQSVRTNFPRKARIVASSIEDLQRKIVGIEWEPGDTAKVRLVLHKQEGSWTDLHKEIVRIFNERQREPILCGVEISTEQSEKNRKFRAFYGGERTGADYVADVPDEDIVNEFSKINKLSTQVRREGIELVGS